MPNPILTVVLAAAVAGATLLPLPSQAGDIQGDAYPCEELWVMRNQVYKDNGYCFKSAKAIKYFGNAGCLYDDEDDVPLSKSERKTIKMISASEKRQGC